MSVCTRFLSAAIGIAASTYSWAVIPESGLWWNPNEPGRGYTIELQNDSMFVAFYGYQPDGSRSAFYTSFGRFDSRSSQMRAPFYSAKDGQCFGCSHRAPELTELGEAHFSFSSPTQGTIRLPGNLQVAIQRMPLVGDSQHSPLAMLGVWTIVDGDRSFFGEALWFRQVTNDIENGFAGHRVGSSNRPALGGPTNNPQLPAMLVLLDSSASHYTAYAFDNSYNRWVGRSWTYPKSGQLSGPGLTSVAHRLIGNAHAQQSSSTTTATKSIDSEIDAQRTDEEREQANARQPKSARESEVQIGDRWYDQAILREVFRELSQKADLQTRSFDAE